MEVICVLEQGRFMLPSSHPFRSKGWQQTCHSGGFGCISCGEETGPRHRGGREPALAVICTHTHASMHTHVHIYARTHITPFSLALFLSPSSCLLSSSRCTSINLQSFVRKIPSKSLDHNSLLPNPPKQGYSRWPSVLCWAMKIVPLNVTHDHKRESVSVHVTKEIRIGPRNL